MWQPESAPRLVVGCERTVSCDTEVDGLPLAACSWPWTPHWYVSGRPRIGAAEDGVNTLAARRERYMECLGVIPEVPDLRWAWAFLLHCASATAPMTCCVLRGLTWFQGSLQGAMRDCGGSAGFLGQAACWASWADSFSIIKKRHRVVERILAAMQKVEGPESTRSE